jgi:hypothetical protein
MIPSSLAGRLVAVFGVRPADVAQEHLETLVTGQVREDADLDFKETHYGNSDAQTRELAADVAAMANQRGGVIILGIREENEVAVEQIDAASGLRARIVPFQSGLRRVQPRPNRADLAQGPASQSFRLHSEL